jgi:O-antigen/teichoic acid export membrane protein
MRRALFAFLSSGVIQLAAVVTGLLAARLLGPGGRGALASVISVTSVIAAVGLLSIGEATVFRTAGAPDDHQRDRILTASLALAVILSIITVMAGWMVDILIFKGRSTLGDALLFLSYVPLNHIGVVLVGSCQGRRSSVAWSTLRATPQTVNAIACIYLLVSGQGGHVRNFLFVQLTGNGVLVCLASSYLLLQGFRFRSFSLATLRGLLSFGVRLHPAAVGTAAREHFDRIFMTIVLSAAALGQYAVAATLAVSLMLIGGTVDMVAFPRIAGESDPEARRTLFLRFARVGIGLVAVTAVGLVTASPVLIPFLFGSAYSPAQRIFPFLCLAYALAASKVVLGAGLKAADHPLKLGGAEVVTLAMIALIMPPMILAYGPIGAAVAACVAQGSSLVFLAYLAMRAYGARIGDILMPRVGDMRFIASRFARMMGW